ncbi:protein lifeguard 1 isoform X2 [Drosophila serrata]|uniref:protein lifeguard 1 isoform X2 n=1 Tax=Drosophila serrata TaxID=7274 RepID=UPI000A1D03E1|nr:protein lifeguard 1 isoform X2 [Drosophila serrata]
MILAKTLVDIFPVNNTDRYPPIPLPAPPLRPGSQSKDSGPEQGAHLMETGAAGGEEFVILEQIVVIKNIVFDDQSIRKGFIRKVFGIFLVQLLFTLGVMAFFLYHEPTKYFVQKNAIVVIVAAIINIMVAILIVCSETVRRKHPVNLVCLAIYTVTMSLLLGALSSFMNADVVLLGVGITAILVIGLSVYALQTKVDYTANGAVLVTFSMFFLLLIAAMCWSPYGGYNNLPFSLFGALLGCFYLIYDIQMMIGGNHQYQFDPEEYVFAALSLYVDVIQILIYVLRILEKFN